MNKLNIEKQLELKQTKTIVPKKEVRKYQNDPYSNKQLRDLGYSDKKVQNYPRDGDKNPYEGDGYRIGSYNDPENRNRDDGRDGRDPNPSDRASERDPRDRGDGRDPRDRGDGRDRGYGYGDNRDGKNRGNDRDYEG